MTKTAIHVLEDGSEEEIKIEDVTDAMAHDTYLCNGCGGTCRVEMYAVRNGKEPHFHTKRNQHHASGCDNDHSIAAQIVRNLDHTGKDITAEDLFEKISKTKSEEGGSGKKRGTGPKDDDVDGFDSDEDFDDDRPINRKSRNPANLKEVCALLSRKDIDDTYAGVLVRDMFVDHRNIREIRKDGLPEEKPVIILLGQISLKRINSLGLIVPDYAIVLGDAYSYADRDEQLICIIKCTMAARKKIFGIKDKKKEETKKKDNTKKEKKIIAIYGKWKKDPLNPGAYICEKIDVNQVFLAEEKFYE